MFGLLSLFKGAWKYLALAGGVLAGVFVMRAQAKREGRQEVKTEQMEKALEDASKAGEIDEDVARLSDDELDRELRGPGRD